MVIRESTRWIDPARSWLSGKRETAFGRGSWSHFGIHRRGRHCFAERNPAHRIVRCSMDLLAESSSEPASKSYVTLHAAGTPRASHFESERCISPENLSRRLSISGEACSRLAQTPMKMAGQSSVAQSRRAAPEGARGPSP